MKRAKGTIDYTGDQLTKLNWIKKVIKNNVMLYDATELKTPHLELTEVLLDKYGEDAENKLIYNIDNSTTTYKFKEQLSL